MKKLHSANNMPVTGVKNYELKIKEKKEAMKKVIKYVCEDEIENEEKQYNPREDICFCCQNCKSVLLYR